MLMLRVKKDMCMFNYLKKSVFVYPFFFCPLSAATLFVGPPPASIQTVINNATAGDTIQLSSGTYTQEISITQNLTLQGNGIGVTTILCPSSPPLTNSFTYTPTGAVYHPIVMVEGASDVIIQNLTLDGGSYSSNFLNYRFLGIGYHNAGGTVQNIRATGVQEDSPAGTTQHGFAIAGLVDDNNPHLINVLNCFVDNFEKSGIDMRGTTLTTVISGNTVTGETPLSTADANGIVIQQNTVATISNNMVSHIQSTVAGDDCVAILLSGAGANSTVQNNTINTSDIGIYNTAVGTNSLIDSNTVTNSTDVGIYVEDNVDLTTITNNTISNSVNINMFLQSDTNLPFALSNNHFIGSPIGLSVQGNTAVGPLVTMNADVFAGQTNYYIFEQTAPNDIWPTTDTVSFDGLVSGSMTFAQYNQVLTKIFDKHNDPALGLVLDYIASPLPPSDFRGIVRYNGCVNSFKYQLIAQWGASLSNDIVLYRILDGTRVVANISATSPLIFIQGLPSKNVADNYTIIALDNQGHQSAPVAIQITFLTLCCT